MKRKKIGKRRRRGKWKRTKMKKRRKRSSRRSRRCMPLMLTEGKRPQEAEGWRMVNEKMKAEVGDVYEEKEEDEEKEDKEVEMQEKWTNDVDEGKKAPGKREASPTHVCAPFLKITVERKLMDV